MTPLGKALSPMSGASELSLRELRFIEAYLANGGNGVAAARQAGYRGDANSLKVTASRALSRANVRAALERRHAEVMANDPEFSPHRVLRRLDQLSHGAEAQGQFSAAVSAETKIGEAAGMFDNVQGYGQAELAARILSLLAAAGAPANEGPVLPVARVIEGEHRELGPADGNGAVR